MLKERGFSTDVEQQEVCPIIELPKDWSGYLRMLDKKQRHELRRKIRRVQGSEKTIDWYIVNGHHDLAEEISHFVRLMAASDPEKEAFLGNDKNLRFFRKIVPLLRDRGWLQMNFLTVDEERAAAYINFVYGDRVMVYNSGHDHRDYADLSPGIVLLAYSIRHAIEQGYQTYDFLRGDEAYKYRMGGRDNPGDEHQSQLNASRRRSRSDNARQQDRAHLCPYQPAGADGRRQNGRDECLHP